MIHFKSITYKNLLATGNQSITIRLDKSPTTLITGQNGAGKSTILDAIYFCLFGKPFRNINKPLLLNSINESDLETIIEFKANNKNYKVIRGIKPNVFEIYQDGKLIDQSSSVRDYQKHLEDNILGGLNEKVFKQVVIIGSADYKPFMQLRAAERREVIEELLDIKIFSQMLTIAKEKNSNIKSKLKNLDYDIDLLQDKIELREINNKKREKNTETKIKELQKKLKEENEKKKNYETKRQENIDKKLKIEAVLSNFPTVKKQLNDIESEKRNLNSKKNQYEETIEFFEKNDDCPTCRQSIDGSHKKNIVNDSEKEIQFLVENIEKYNDDIKSVKEKIHKLEKMQDIKNKLNESLYKINTEIKYSKKFIEKIEKEIEDIKNIKKDNHKITIGSLKDEKADKEKSRKKLLNESDYLDIASNLLKDGGIKTKIIKQYVPIMNKTINEYLIRFGLPVDFNLDESFNEVIRSRHRDNFQYNNFSEGEKQRIDISLLLAWRQIAKDKNTTNTNLLVLDEVFDASLDMNATEELLNILLSMNKTTNIFVISHKSDLEDKLRSHIHFEKHGNFTRISENK